MARPNSGYVIKESLEDTSVLASLDVIGTDTYSVPTAGPDQPDVWTGVSFSVTDDGADEIVERLSKALKPGPWWIDLASSSRTYIVYCGRVFSYTVRDLQGRDEAIEFGRSSGVPEAQLELPRPNWI